jgi:hypothetical protein
MKKIYSFLLFMAVASFALAQSPWINEIHYDNAGGDVDEGFEIAGPAGTDLSCYAVMLYNGSDDELYGNNNDSIVLTGSIDDEGCGFGAVWFGLPANGLQNGAPDGIGLYNHCTSTVVQFLSYEGVIASAGDGPMIGLASTDIGVMESGIQVIGGSLQLTGIGTSYASFTWDSTGVNSTDVLNPGQLVCGAPADTTVKFTTTSSTTNEGVGTFTLNLSIDQITNANQTVDVALLSGTAANLTNTFPEIVTFTAGSNSATLVLNLVDDAVIESDETYEFILQSPSALVLGSDSIFTLTAEDDDTPIQTYPIATVTAVDASGVVDSTGLECKLYGIVNSPDRGFSSTEFSFHDGTGAITAYNGGTSISYDATVGDSVEVIGTIGERFGVTVITSLTSVTALSSGATVVAVAASLPIESNESFLIRVDGLQLVDAAQWTTGTGQSGFDVQVYTANNDTFIVRIDRDYDDLYNSTDIPCGVFDVIGVGSQYDITSPFTENYQLVPRFLSDFMDTCTIVAPSLTIGAASEVDAVTGEPVLFGSNATLKGIITSPDFRELQGDGTEFSFADATGGIWAYSTDSAISFNPVVGDSVEVSGEIYGSSGVTRLRIATVTSLGAATPFTPTVVTSALDESHEAELITLEDLEITSGSWATTGGSYNISATNSNGTYDIRIDADRAELFQPILSSGETFHLTGIGTQFDPTAPRTEGYQVLPRFDSDINIQVVGIKEIELANFSVSPVPAIEVLNVQFDFDTQEVASARLINVIGQVAVAQEMNLLKGSNQQTILVGDLNPGFYVLQIETSKGFNNTSVLIK